MLMHIGKMKKGETVPVSFSETVSVPAAFGLSENETPVSVQGVLKKEGDFFAFTGELKATFAADCGLCLAPVLNAVCVPLCDKFSETLDTLGEEDVWPIVSKNIDFSESVLSALLMAIPARFVCFDGCKGLCPVCGADRNKTACACENDKIDERFAGLKELFKEV
ncbi:MAG: DUF177 domain-containing protein [Clostridiales bacterium]|nr:DUF177 domain-containing protein [Clostridiales bacterium]